MSHIEEWGEFVQIALVVAVITAPIWIPIYFMYYLYTNLTPSGRKRIAEEKKRKIEYADRERERIAMQGPTRYERPPKAKQEPWTPNKTEEYLNKLIK